MITADGVIIYSRYELARLQARKTLHCIEYEITEQEALHWILQMHRRSNGFNDFTRILLALELEPWLREKALLNQRAGGQNKGLSKLTEACSVRSKVAQAAGVCEGNITMVKQLMARAHPDLFEALRSGEIRIHRAWKWSKQSTAKQIQALRFYRSKKGVHKAIRRLISSLKPRSRQIVFDLGRLMQLVSGLGPDEASSLGVWVVQAPGKMVYVTEELVQALGSQQELALHAQ